jgi:hypothetical protein
MNTQKLTVNDIPTVAFLRKNGYKVKVEHARLYKDPANNDIYLTDYERSLAHEWRDLKAEQKGGITTVTISSPNTPDDLVGVSTCGKNDGFDRKKGVKYAMARAFFGSLDMANDLIRSLEGMPVIIPVTVKTPA